MSKARKLQFPLKYEHFGLVEGTGTFPIDALRYDSAHPWKESDGREVENSLNILARGNGKWRVIVRRHTNEGSPQWSSIWDSFSQVRFTPISPEDADEINRKRDNGDPQYVPPLVAFEQSIHPHALLKLARDLYSALMNETAVGVRSEEKRAAAELLSKLQEIAQ